MLSARKPAPVRESTPARPGTAGNRAGNSLAASPSAAKQDGPPWVPGGIRPHSPPRNIAAPTTGTRRNRAVEHAHVFLDSPELPADDPSNFCWLYGAFDYKLQCPPEKARETVFRIIDKLVDRMNKLNPPPPPPTLETFSERFGAGADQQTSKLGSSLPALGLTAINDTAADGRGGGKKPPAGKQPRAPHKVKGSLIFDIISTKKHIGQIPEKGLPFKLGREIYHYVDTNHGLEIVTTFVGLTDNTARRVGRDIYYSKTDELSKNRIGFHYVDREHMFIIFPEKEVPPEPEAGVTSLLGGGALSGTYGSGILSNNNASTIHGRSTAGLNSTTSFRSPNAPKRAASGVRPGSSSTRGNNTTTTSALPSSLRKNSPQRQAFARARSPARRRN